MKNPWKSLEQKTVYDNQWIKVDEHQVLNPKGKPGIYSVVHFKNIALAIIPLDEDYNTWIVGQYRFLIDEYSWEVPEGGGPLLIDPLESAKRELLEEVVGLKAENWLKIIEMKLSNSVSDEKGIIYVAKKLSFHESEPEENEELTVRKLPCNSSCPINDFERGTVNYF